MPDGAPRFVEESHGQGAGWLGPALQPVHDRRRPEPPGLPRRRLPPARRRRLRAARPTASGCSRSSTTQARPAGAELAQVRGDGRATTSGAYDLLTAPQAPRAFDLTREDPRLRARYGLHPHGQAVLQARRLVEAGVPLVTVFWQNDGIDQRQRLLGHAQPQLHRPEDAAHARRPTRRSRPCWTTSRPRGLLDETLVVWTGEFGRTPRVGQSGGRRRRGRARRPRPLAALLHHRPGRRGHPRRDRLRRHRPLGRLPGHATRSPPPTSPPRSTTCLGIDPATRAARPARPPAAALPGDADRGRPGVTPRGPAGGG